MGLLPKKKKKKFFSTGTLVEECCDKIPFCNIGRLYKGFFFSLSRSMCMCFFKKWWLYSKRRGEKKREGYRSGPAGEKERKKEKKKEGRESLVLSWPLWFSTYLQKNHLATLLKKLKN